MSQEKKGWVCLVCVRVLYRGIGTDMRCVVSPSGTVEEGIAEK